jgi:hypothetical protein
MIDDDQCAICGANLSYSVVALARGYCDVCRPDECPECGCEHITQRRNHSVGHARMYWKCDNGCFFEVAA